jgi:hypothetical protein
MIFPIMLDSNYLAGFGCRTILTSDSSKDNVGVLAGGDLVTGVVTGAAQAEIHWTSRARIMTDWIFDICSSRVDLNQHMSHCTILHKALQPTRT